MAEPFEIREEGKATVVELISELDRLSVFSIKTRLRELAKKRRHNNFIVNFSQIDHINSTIVGALVGVRTMAKEHGGDLVLCDVNSNIRRTLDLIGASKVLSIYDTEEDALENI